MTAARAEKLFSIDIVDTPPPLRVEAVDQPARPPLAAIAPEPPGEPIPGGNLGSVNRQRAADLPAPTTPAPSSPPTAAEAHAASMREAAIARRRQAKPRAGRPPAPVPPPVVIPPPPTDTRH
jgi:hypothetical protein